LPAGVKGIINNNIQNSVQQHDEAIDNALEGQNEQPPEIVVPGTLKTGWLTRKGRDGKDVKLFFAYPATLNKSKPTAGLIVLQEWWGVNKDMQERTQDLASKGFYAVAPDLFNGKVTDDPDEAAKLKNAMNNTAALSAMRTGLDLLSEEERNGIVNPLHVGVVGWCMGGEQGLKLAMADPRIRATAIFYGPLETNPDLLGSVKGPVLGIFGNDDKNPSPQDVEKFKKALFTTGKTGDQVTIYQYDGVGHAFASKSAAKMGAYNEEKAKDAFNHLYAWLDKTLPR